LNQPTDKKKTTIGGQALIEGIMMKGVDKMATAIRRADGTIEIRERRYTPIRHKIKILGWPVIRGVTVMAESLKMGYSELMYSSTVADLGGETEPTGKFDAWLDKKLSSKTAEKVVMGISVVIGVLVPIVLFFILPAFLTGLLAPLMPRLVVNLLEGAARMIIFLLFLFGTSRIKDMRRVYAYHGAEHKSIACYEAGEPLEVDNVRKFSRRHPRCGTSFLFVVMIISILIFSFITVTNPWLRIVLRLLLIPVVMGVSYEFNRFAGRYDNWLTRALRAPGLWVQGFTTFEPEDGMMEAAIEALRRVIPEQDGADKW